MQITDLAEVTKEIIVKPYIRNSKENQKHRITMEQESKVKSLKIHLKQALATSQPTNNDKRDIKAFSFTS